MAAVLALSGLTPSPGALAQSDRSLRIFPSPISLAPDQSMRVEAYLCRRLQSGDVYGPDGSPGTDDDRCEPAKRARWSVVDAKVAQVKPKNGASVKVTGKKDGLTTLEARFEATSTSSFVSRTPVDVVEPLPDPATGAADDQNMPGVDITVLVHPEFVVLSPGDQQLFVGYACPTPRERDPRGPDGLPGNTDDFCKPVDGTWRFLSDSPFGTLDPIEGFFTVLDTDAQEDTAFLASVAGVQAVTTPETGSTTNGAIGFDTLGRMTGAGVALEEEAEARDPPRSGDVDGDGDVDLADAIRILDHIRPIPGSREYDPALDLDGDGFIGMTDVFLALAYSERA